MHKDYLKICLDEALGYKGQTAPNPAVGCVVVKEGKVLARGAHQLAGQPHAEVNALNQLTPAERKGSTVYISLEPCCFEGKTPACTDLLIKSEVKKVVFSERDPNPKVSGRGQYALEEAGIEVEHQPFSFIRNFYESYRYWTTHKRPFVTAKIALSMDGKIAGPHGEPSQISGPELGEFTHTKRKQSDALLTTFQTVLKDNPKLNARLKENTYKKHLYVIDRKLEAEESFNIFSTAKSITLFCSQEHYFKRHQYEASQVHVIPVPLVGDGLCLSTILDQIGEDGIHDLWVEAGGKLFERLSQEALIQRSFVYICEKQLGPLSLPAFSREFKGFRQAKHFALKRVGADTLCEVGW